LATILPVAAGSAVALWRIRDRRLIRYSLLALALAISLGEILIGGLGFIEGFHFIEYGVVALLFYRAWYAVGDGSAVVLPLLAGLIVAAIDEWFQWFIPIRAGEARDIGIDCVATACGVLLAVAIRPPRAVTQRPSRASVHRVYRVAAMAVAAFFAFVIVVQMGYQVSDSDTGSFRSRYTAEALEQLAHDRAERWRVDPPRIQRRLSREDQYLSEGLWRVRRRNQAWSDGDIATAWHENLILEKFYAPVLDTPTYASASRQRWPAAQRDDARARAGDLFARYDSRDYPYALYVWPRFLTRN
jgi:hypothetical protein